MDKVHDLSSYEKKRWVAEVKFLKAYYHFYLFRMYGPIPVMDVNTPVGATPDEVKPYREPDAFGWVLPRLFDGDINTGFHTMGTRMPQWVTFDLGVKAKISRIVAFQRPRFEYMAATRSKFELWGTNDLANLGDWNAYTKMADCEFVKPSGLPLGQNSDEDLAKAAAGDEFPCYISAPAVRYLRLKALESWERSANWALMEIEVYGNIVEEE